MKIGILQTGRHPEELADQHADYDVKFQQLLDGAGFEFATYAALDGQLPDSVHDADGWLITGSKFGVYEQHLWISALQAFIVEAYQAKRPIVGICFGHQLLAQALGGKVEKFSGGWSIGPKKYRLHDTGQVLTLNSWHQDQVVKLPPDAKVFASNDFCQYAGLAYGDRALSWQPHPEFDATYMKGLFAVRKNMLPPDVANEALTTLDTPTSEDRVAEQIIDFFNAHKRG